MAKLRFLEGILPSGYRYSFEPFSFNREEYRLVQAKDHWSSFYILNEKDFVVEGDVHFYCRELAQSNIQSPFGGFEFSNAVGDEDLFGFMHFVFSKLAARKVKGIWITHPPEAYQPRNHALVKSALQQCGFEVAKSEITSLVKITDAQFSDRINSGKRWMLLQTLKYEFQFQELAVDSVNDVYDFIEHHRRKKGYHLSITREHLKHSVSALRDYYHLFGVYHEGKLVAASVAVRVSKTILYHFISDHVRKIELARPALFLMQGIYDFCKREGIKLLDLGTSMNGSDVNVKLLKFKEESGGESSNKFTFKKDLSDD